VIQVLDPNDLEIEHTGRVEMPYSVDGLDGLTAAKWTPAERARSASALKNRRARAKHLLAE